MSPINIKQQNSIFMQLANTGQSLKIDQYFRNGSANSLVVKNNVAIFQKTTKKESLIKKKMDKLYLKFNQML